MPTAQALEPRGTRSTWNEARAVAPLILAMASLLAIADRVPLHWEAFREQTSIRDLFAFYLEGVNAGSIGGPYVYRLLVPRTIALIQGVVPALSPLTVDLGLKLIALCALQLQFFVYVRHFVSFALAFAGVLWLDALTGYALAYLAGPTVIETGDLFAVCFMLGALQALHARRDALLYALLAVSMLNRETSWVVLPAIASHALVPKEQRTRASLVRCALATLAVAVPYFGLRLALDAGVWFQDDFTRNTDKLDSAVAAAVHVLLVLAPPLALAAARPKDIPLFLQHTAAIVPAYIAVSYAFGRVLESRLWLPLFPVLISLALCTLTRFDERSPC